ncbi:MAG: hypothetical protein M3Z05_00135 [Gemmatimonadota bacterium]|nr:hypothetical protein [Gemmatimonadota bacterium]
MSAGSSTDAQGGSTGAFDHLLHLVEGALRLPESPANRWHRAGVTHRTERMLDIGGGAVVLLLAIGWAWTIATSGSRQSGRVGPSAASQVAAALTSGDAPTAAYLTDASLSALAGELRGASGKLRAEIKPAGAPLAADGAPQANTLTVAESETSGPAIAPSAGIWKLAVAVGNAIRPISDFNLISMRPRSDKQNGKVGLYYLGNWPGETGPVSAPKKAPADRYRPPSGFIEVTQANADTRLSDHFKLRDFLTHDQVNVWPKYLVIEMRNVDKLELILSDLASRGINVSGIHIMSGFRTPQYNKGGGTTTGRAGLSRHMYGDAADVFIDSDGNGVMDDLNHDGKINIEDARVILQAQDRVEAAHPELVGGGGVYPAESGHGPFIHIDSRGYRARWIGSGGG